MDELTNAMLELGTDDYLDDMDYLHGLLREQEKKKREVLAMIILFWKTKKNKRKLLKEIERELAIYFEDLEKSLNSKFKEKFELSFLMSTYIQHKFFTAFPVAIPEMPDMKWHVGEKSYVDDLEYFKNRLFYDIKKNIESGLVLEETESELSDIVDKPFGTLNKSTKSLTDTELTFVERKATIESIKACGGTHYLYKATLDTKTCERCTELDGKTFNVSTAQVGVNFPPMHPHCRCIVTMVGKESEKSIPDTMSFSVWMNKFVKG